MALLEVHDTVELADFSYLTFAYRSTKEQCKQEWVEIESDFVTAGPMPEREWPGVPSTNASGAPRCPDLACFVGRFAWAAHVRGSRARPEGDRVLASSLLGGHAMSMRPNHVVVQIAVEHRFADESAASPCGLPAVCVNPKQASGDTSVHRHCVLDPEGLD